MNNKKKNRIILCICSIFILVASIFSFIPLSKDTYVVKADSVLSDYSFSGSNISSNTTFTNGNFTNNIFRVNDNIGYSITRNGVTATVNDDYTITLNGTNTGANVYWNIFSSISLGANDSNKRLDLNSNNTYSFVLKHISGSYTGSPTTDDQVVGVSIRKQDGNTIVDGININLSVRNTSNDVLYVTRSGIDYLNNGYFRTSTGITYDNFTFGFMVSEGTTDVFVPFQNRTQLNYDFDFRVRNANYTNFVTLEFGVGFDIQDSLGYDYAVVGGQNSSTIYNIDRLISIAYSFLPYAGSLYCYRYDYNNNVFDRNYYFKLPYTFDYVESYNNQIPFNGNIKYVVLGSYKDRDTYFHFDNYGAYQIEVMDFLKQSKYNFISYVDENGNNLNFYIPLDSSVDSDYFIFRTYYLSNEYLDSSVYTNGYRDGYVSGEDNGYKNGYNIGKNDGYNLGYNTAIGNEKYTFTSLISSVIDVPVKAFTSLFNFDILGVNLSGFFLGLLTCCIVIGVIRLIL